VMIPVFLLLILPGWFIARYLFRRARKMQLARWPKPGTTSDSSQDSNKPNPEKR
jgi:hypothetical protein